MLIPRTPGDSGEKTILFTAESLDGNETSVEVPVGPGIVGVQIAVLTNTSAVGVFTVESSIPGSGKWVQEVFLDGSDEVTVASAATLDALVHLNSLGSGLIRLVWTGSGTGTFSAWFLVK